MSILRLTIIVTALISGFVFTSPDADAQSVRYETEDGETKRFGNPPGRKGKVVSVLNEGRCVLIVRHWDFTTGQWQEYPIQPGQRRIVRWKRHDQLEVRDPADHSPKGKFNLLTHK